MTMLDSADEPPHIPTACAPQASVVVCTYGRSGSLPNCLKSILQGNHSIEVLLIDQNPPGTLDEVIQPFLSEPRLKHILTDELGKGKALNLALSKASAPIVCITDDDCEVPVGWTDALTCCLDRHPHAAAAFCNVEPGQFDQSQGFIPACHTDSEHVIDTVKKKAQFVMLGAGMAIRTNISRDLFGFDPAFGPGGVFSSGDEDDFALRAILRGHQIVYTNCTSVVHHGFRTWQQGKDLARRDLTAFGAVCGKLDRAFPKEMRKYWPAVYFREVVMKPLRAVARGRKPSGLAGVMWFILGFLRGRSIGPDPRTLLMRQA